MFMPPYGGCNFPYKSNLRWISEMIKALRTAVDSLEETDKTHTNDITSIKTTLTQMEQEIQDIIDGKLPDNWYQIIENYVNGNFPDIILKLISFVFFGLTDDGHFAAYISKNLSFLSFDTDVTAGSENYGRLVLKY